MSETTRAPALILLAHGTRDPAGSAQIEDLAASLRAHVAEVRVAYADVRSPTLAQVLPDLPGPVVIVPAFLATGYHVRVDVPAQLAAIGREDVAVTTAFGPDPLLIAAAHARLQEAGWAGEPVVLGAAGSSDAQARDEVQVAADRLAERLGVPVRVGFATGEPGAADVVTAVRAEFGGAVAMATWLLAPGVFHTRLGGCGADRTAAPLGGSPHVVDLVLKRYRVAA